MLDKVKELIGEVTAFNATTKDEIETFRIKFLSKKGLLNDLFDEFKNVAPAERKEFGQALNTLKNLAQDKVNELKDILENSSEQKGFYGDLTRPEEPIELGSRHPISLVRNKIIDVFSRIGFTVSEGPEIEDDWHNFTALNLPEYHPARDMQDTFYITEDTLLRTHTSPVQVRTMLEKGGKEPIKILCPGKVFRRDADDATHSHQFMQIEGLVVDTNTSMADLKGTLLETAKKLFGEKRDIRLRPSYFPFTEPSVEVDVSCHNCNGKGCNVCKGTGWIEILGSGMVNDNVLEACGYDSKKYQGFAFGMGVERIAMLKYGINDIRSFYTNDLRFIKQFKK